MAFRMPLAFRQGPRRKKKAIALIPKWNLLRGDKVEVIAGKNKGAQGTIETILRDRNACILEGINMRQRHVKSTPATSGKLYLAPGPIHYSNLNLIDPSIGKPTRIAIRYTEEGERIRVSKKTGTVIPKPEMALERSKPRPTETGLWDTLPEDVLERTVDDSEIKKL